MLIRWIVLAGLLVPAMSDGLASPSAGAPVPAADHLVSARGIGPIVLGESLGEARRRMPSAAFRRTSDGDGAALVELLLPGGESLMLWADEDDPDRPIDWAKRIRTVETFHPAFSTADGIAVGVPVAEAERVWGPVREIVESEIESRQFVTFERQPASFEIRIDYSGLFAPGTRRTTRYRPDARILSIAVSSK